MGVPAGGVGGPRWKRGYDEALHDLLDAVQRGGTESALQWILDNSSRPEDRSAAREALDLLQA